MCAPVSLKCIIMTQFASFSALYHCKDILIYLVSLFAKHNYKFGIIIAILLYDGWRCNG